MNKPDESRLLTEEIISYIVTAYHFSSIENRHILAKQVAKAQLAEDIEWEAKKDAECQARVERMLDEIGEDCIATIVNFYIPKEDNQTRAFDVWNQIKKQVLKKQEGE